MLPKAPPLSGTDWLNSDPLSTDHLRGRPVVVLFWTSTCEGSWVRLRQLEALEARYGNTVHVVAVHSPRFAYEQRLDTLENSIASRSVSIPVLHDPHLNTWARYGPIGRPTVVVLDHRQRVVGAMAGTDPESIDALDKIVGEQVALAGRPVGKRQVIDRAATPEADVRPPHRLHGPASVTRLIDGRIVIADRGNGRLISVTIDDSEIDRPIAHVSTVYGGLHGIGDVTARSDGQVSVTFPDSGTVDSIDLATKARRSIATGLIRPIGLIEDRDGSLVVADAGADQLLRITHDTAGPIAGSGVSGSADGRSDRAQLSQPLAVTRIDAGLLFVEASSGAVRLLTDQGKVQTINAGQRAGLLDGPAHRALYQRPTGLATLEDGAVAIADCGNDRIRLMRNRKVTTLPVSGLSRPEALLYLGHRQLLCCDTANDRIVLIDLDGQTVDELAIRGLPL